ncbi:MAG: OmpA family protein [Deltaproteobacteria bacterium]|jgi:outer membrane protein OmpA-like peptidoglycan-associated protein
MNTKHILLSLCVPATMIACSSSATRSGPSATPVPTERAGDGPSPVADGSGTHVGVKSNRTGDADGIEKWTNINYSKKTPMTASLVRVDAETAKACNLGEQEIYFAYDSANVEGFAADKLSAIADCLKKDDGMIEVIGYTDPRGSDTYNEELGMSRAQSVANVLEANGVPSKRLTTDSKGESGTLENPAGWPIARRVEIRANGEA